jgi:hypothetical protein
MSRLFDDGLYNNNNLFLRSRPSHTKFVYETPLFVGMAICKDVINGLVHMLKHDLFSSSKSPPLKFPMELQMEDHNIEFRECVAHHDHPLIIKIST